MVKTLPILRVNRLQRINLTRNVGVSIIMVEVNRGKERERGQERGRKKKRERKKRDKRE